MSILTQIGIFVKWLLRSRGRIISFHLLCVAPDYTLYSLRFGLAFQLSRLIPQFSIQVTL
nr:MAG TPA: hypothetical protein [Caudoviricetes sp.]